jgi:hypothetical protein
MHLQQLLQTDARRDTSRDHLHASLQERPNHCDEEADKGNDEEPADRNPVNVPTVVDWSDPHFPTTIRLTFQTTRAET